MAGSFSVPSRAEFGAPAGMRTLARRHSHMQQMHEIIAATQALRNVTERHATRRVRAPATHLTRFLQSSAWIGGCPSPAGPHPSARSRSAGNAPHRQRTDSLRHPFRCHLFGIVQRNRRILVCRCSEGAGTGAFVSWTRPPRRTRSPRAQRNPAIGRQPGARRAGPSTPRIAPRQHRAHHELDLAEEN